MDLYKEAKCKTELLFQNQLTAHCLVSACRVQLEHQELPAGVTGAGLVCMGLGSFERELRQLEQ